MGEFVREYRPQILHEPNMASGGQAMRIEVGDFLVREAHGPQHAELLRLISALIGRETLAAEAIDGGAFDLAIIDVLMPEAFGFVLAKRAAERNIPSLL
jgi:hypothetical protein